MGFVRPVLFEGAEYPGVWLECAPLEGLVYEPLSPEIAFNNHDIFFALQRDDGYIPYGVKKDTVGSGQIQMAVPIAATAWDCTSEIATRLSLKEPVVLAADGTSGLCVSKRVRHGSV